MAAPAPSYSLHDCAVNAEAALEKLTTEMAHAGIDPKSVAVVTAMAATVRQIVKVLGNGAEGSPSEEAGESPQVEATEPGEHTIGSATAAMHAHILAQHAGR